MGFHQLLTCGKFGLLFFEFLLELFFLLFCLFLGCEGLDLLLEFDPVFLIAQVFETVLRNRVQFLFSESYVLVDGL